jgi:hypothetical protein
MRRLSAPGVLPLTAVLLAASLAAAPLRAAGAAAAPGEQRDEAGLRGRVATETAPLGRVTVYAYELARLQTRKVMSAADGGFRFDSLPAGVYKLIAFKVGYEPAVVMLSRAAADALQFVDLKLVEERPADTRRGEGFWAVRDQIPPDVLRDLEGVRLAELAMVPSGSLGTRAFSTNFSAMTGVEDLGGGSEGQLAGGGIGMEGRIGSIDVGVTGEYWQLAGSPTTSGVEGPAAGQATALALRMSAAGEAQLDFTTVSQRLGAGISRGIREGDTADFERYRVSWSQPFGERSLSRFEAQYTSQSNFFMAPAVIGAPSETRAFNLEGAYAVEISEGSGLEAGLRYRERTAGYGLSPLAEPQRALEIFGTGDIQLRPSVLVEYGMATQLRDGSVALAPQGGVVVQLGPRWQAIASGSQRIEDGAAPPLDGFAPVRFSNNAGQACDGLDEHCYRVLLARQGEGDDLFAIAGVHRELAEALHLYFDDDFLNHLESLYLVEGDQLPEVQVVFERRIAPRVLARLESSYADGGGGLLYAVDREASQEAPYQNRVRYLVTSFDTHFQTSSTGVFVAFHHLEQGAEPLDEGDVEILASQLQRLELMLSQDLNVLMSLAAEWAVHVNFELSRGSLPFTLQEVSEDDELRRRVTGGLTVKF